ncbi:MAG: ATP-dependent DNA helicase RecG [Alphaproteobacteria bacterium]|nr:ATP-dependent DNA helicase RecG [Alphaproteobacteria bacterium]MCY4499048.1 ATP-dependent DNA helicase RecG [Rhodospirillaceae bacterium]
MRPEILFSTFAPVSGLPGVGPRIAKLIEKVAGPRLVDLYWHLPTQIVDRRYSPSLARAPDGAIVTVTVVVERHTPAPGKRLPYKVFCSDGSGQLTLVFFHAKPDYLQRALPVGEERVVSGRIRHYGDEVQITHPDHIGTAAELDALKAVEPVYRLTAGLTARPLQRAVRLTLDQAPDLPEWLEPQFVSGRRWQGWKDALLAAHAPESPDDLEPGNPARERLAYDELLANQLALALVRESVRRGAGRAVSGDSSLRKQVVASLPYSLTSAQERALEEIWKDMASPARMLRLLQGDVGSGKTIVAFLAMLNAVESGAQAALMAPTEVLAQQHGDVLTPLCAELGIRLALLTGREKGKFRRETLADLEAGDIDILVGTHAIFQEGVAFSDLAFAVIDEQHRFGVHQRLALTAKAAGARANLLVMTATPIPRTLTMTAYGDMDVSQLDEKPPGRIPVDTRAMPLERLDEVVQAVRRAVGDGDRVYWVCPLVEESDVIDIAAAEARYAALAGNLGNDVALLHGRMKSAEKDAHMSRFAGGEISVLVATTVIEVGVDVPEATVMVVEHAERFGLAQLHQLRGRVGRGDRQGRCLLLYAAPLGDTARARIRIMRETDDGFRIAEEDLRLRGAGEVLGTRQSGLPDFRLADVGAHEELMLAARDDAKLVLERDPDLSSDRGQALRALLYLFERDAAVGYLRSG